MAAVASRAQPVGDRPDRSRPARRPARRCAGRPGLVGLDDGVDRGRDRSAPSRSGSSPAPAPAPPSGRVVAWSWSWSCDIPSSGRGRTLAGGSASFNDDKSDRIQLDNRPLHACKVAPLAHPRRQQEPPRARSGPAVASPHRHRLRTPMPDLARLVILALALLGAALAQAQGLVSPLAPVTPRARARPSPR